jgi:hypothetical protein
VHTKDNDPSYRTFFVTFVWVRAFVMAGITGKLSLAESSANGADRKDPARTGSTTPPASSL